MNRTVFLAGTLATMVVLVGLVAAHDPDPNANCNSIQDESIALPIVGHVHIATPVGTVYPVAGSVDTPDLPVVGIVTIPFVQIWAESNGWEGAQTHGHTCRTSPDHVSHDIGADTRIL